MIKVENLETYKKAISNAKKKYTITFSNMYCMMDEIMRYISLGRMYLEEIDGGVAYYLDEESYYKLCLYVDPGELKQLPKVDKKVLFRYIHREGTKGNSILVLEEFLKQKRFVQKGLSTQVLGITEEILDNRGDLARGISILERNGFRIVRADESMLEEIERLIAEVPFIEDYHMDYKTLEEKRNNLKQGGYLCVVDREGKVCATTVTWVNGNMAAGGAIAVRDKYKMLGLAPAICYERMKYLHDEGVERLIGWVLLNNEPSLRYHKSMGFHIGDRYADEWLWEE